LRRNDFHPAGASTFASKRKGGSISCRWSAGHCHSPDPKSRGATPAATPGRQRPRSASSAAGASFSNRGWPLSEAITTLINCYQQPDDDTLRAVAEFVKPAVLSSAVVVRAW